MRVPASSAPHRAMKSAEFPARKNWILDVLGFHEEPWLLGVALCAIVTIIFVTLLAFAP